MKSPPPRPDVPPPEGNPASGGGGASPVAPSQEALIADLFSKYHAKLVKSLVARTGSWEEARDIASQAFVEVLAQRPGTVSFLGPYLYRTARNLATNRLTHRAMRRRKDSMTVDDSDSYPSPEPLWAEQEHVAILKQAVEGLSPRLRTAFILRIWDELSYEEIALRFAANGVKLNVRTVQRYVAEAFQHCRRHVLAAANAPGAMEAK